MLKKISPLTLGIQAGIFFVGFFLISVSAVSAATECKTANGAGYYVDLCKKLDQGGCNGAAVCDWSDAGTCLYIGEEAHSVKCGAANNEECAGMHVNLDESGETICQWMGQVEKKEEDKKNGEEKKNAGGPSNSDLEKLTRSSFLRTGTTDLKLISGRILQTAMGVMGSIALIMFVYGGFLFMTARGDSEHYEKGTNILLWSSLGVVVIFSSYALLKFVFEIFT